MSDASDVKVIPQPCGIRTGERRDASRRQPEADSAISDPAAEPGSAAGDAHLLSAKLMTAYFEPWKARSHASWLRVLSGFIVMSAVFSVKSTWTSSTPSIFERASRTLAAQLWAQVMPLTAR
jgi:hypothetical protein